MDPLNQWKCTICNVVVQASNKSGHLYGKRHRAQKAAGLAPWTCDVCALTMMTNNKHSHLAGARHLDALRAANEPSTGPPMGSLWTCSVCGLQMAGPDKDKHVAAHAPAAQAANPDSGSGWAESFDDIEWGDEPDLGNSNDPLDWAQASEEGDQYATSPDESNVWTQRLLQTQLVAALNDRDTMASELTSARKAWDEKEHTLLMKTDELRAKIVALNAHLDATKADCTVERNLRMSAELALEQEKTSRMGEAGIVEGLDVKLKEALDEKQRLMKALDRKIESIKTGRSILSLARTKLSDVTSARDALTRENAAQASQIKALQHELNLANKRLSSQAQEIADEQLIWKDDEDVEGEKRQQEDEIRRARERLEKMRRDELEQKAAEEAKEKKRAEEKRAREVEEEMKRRAEEEARIREAEKEKKQVYTRWENAFAREVLRQRSISRTRFQANHRATWTSAQALHRFIELLEELPSLVFSAEQPLTLWSVPWPVLANPVDLAAEKIDWKATEAFFAHAKKVLSEEKYNEMVSRAQKLFHPDRWVGKLALVLDDGVRESLQKVINTVEQVINSLITR